MTNFSDRLWPLLSDRLWPLLYVSGAGVLAYFHWDPNRFGAICLYISAALALMSVIPKSPFVWHWWCRRMLIPFYTAGLVWIIAATASTHGWGHLSTIVNMVGAGITVGMGLKATYDAELAEITVGR